MRLSENQILLIKSTVLKFFGESAQVWLFGSRADDKKKGGDIDLYIESNSTDLFNAKIFTQTCLEGLFPYPIDIVVHEKNQNLAIFRIAKTQGIKL